VQTVVAAGTLTHVDNVSVGDIIEAGDDYLPMHLVSEPAKFDEREIAAALVYPPIALRSGIEGRVILDLFIDRNGVVQQVRILQENPPDRGFGEAAIKAFLGRKGTPAMANGSAVSMRYRYPLTFRIR
jgi:protein TonB